MPLFCCFTVETNLTVMIIKWQSTLKVPKYKVGKVLKNLKLIDAGQLVSPSDFNILCSFPSASDSQLPIFCWGKMKHKELI